MAKRMKMNQEKEISVNSKPDISRLEWRIQIHEGKTVCQELRNSRWVLYLIGQIIIMDYVAHHPNRLVERTEFIISIATTKEKNKIMCRSYVSKINLTCL